MSISSLTPLHSFKEPAILYAGQASAWQQTVADASADHIVASHLRELLSRARAKTALFARQIVSVVPGSLARLEELTGEDPQLGTEIDPQPAVSIPGIVLGQIAASRQLRDLGLDVDNATRLGHSQGILGVEAAVNEEDTLAFAILLGAAASQYADKGDHMLSVRGLKREIIESAINGIDSVEIALRNARAHFVLSGQPAQLKKAAAALQRAADAYNEDINEKRKGGSLAEPAFDYLPVAIPFHHSSMQAAADLAVEWSNTCGLNVDARTLAESILVKPADWVAEISTLHADYVLGLDSGLVRFTQPLLEGTGTTLLPAFSAAERDNLARPGFQIPTAADWSEFAPKLVKLPNGELKVQTGFSTLTGYSPILLAGMTPTTVDPAIVAAAANDGYWAEMAGGGQYSEEVFTKNKDKLVSLLETGRSAQFNSMFFDRYMWNLQFGAQRIVSKARAAGTSINGVVVSAGIPEVEEATELINDLNADGFPYIAFKPGTVDQIRATLKIADGNPDSSIIIQVEDGHAGGHHSWVNLDDLLLSTYAEIRSRKNVVVVIGGGIGTPAKAAEYLTGEWAAELGYPKMPVDGILVGTAAMATKEATTSPQVKQALVDTPGIDPHDAGGWVGRGDSRGGVTSGLSHLHADMYELDNDSAAASRLISSIDSDDVEQHREELIAAINKTAKPFFGDLEDMSYAQWLERWVELAYPSQDPTWDDRLFDLVHRVEARLNDADHGEITTLFPDLDSIGNAPEAVDKLLGAYPHAADLKVSARDAAWFIGLCRKHHKPMPWVPAIDADLARWWGLDTLWQSQNERYDANSVRVIPGPVSVAGIDRVDEPVAELLGRFEQACVEVLDGEPIEIFSRLNEAKTERELLLSAPHIVWHGNLIDNPAHILKDGAFELIEEDGYWIIRILADSYFDDIPVDQRPYLVQHVDIPVELDQAVATGASPVVSRDKLPESVFALLAGVAGVGSTSAAGDEITALPTVEEDGLSPFGLVRDSFTLPAELLSAHTAVTGAALDEHNSGTPDVLVGVCWPAIYAALGSGKLADGYPVIEGLLNAVHLDHLLDLRVPLDELANGRTIDVEARTDAIEESSSGRIVTVRLELRSAGEIVAKLVTRFAIRGRITTTALASQAAAYGGREEIIEDTPRSFVRSATVSAPADMTPFAMVSGDYNPIHTSDNAAKLVGLDAALVHGMWLSATAQHLAGLGSEVIGWTYSMYGMVQLNDVVDITVERVGRSGLQPAYEVTCRIEGNVVSRGQALLSAPHTAYVYPGQGIQAKGMGQGDRNASAEARAVWERADAHTRAHLGFSIQQVIDENPVELKVGETTFVHPKGVLNLTQFTQVALAVVAYAQTERLIAADAVIDNSLYAGHSLGEYTALASLGNIFELEGVIDVVFSRGSAMHSLVPRDEHGRSNYALAAFRPNMIGLSGAEVENWVDRVAAESGEFLQIVNYNVDGQQYAVAGTLKGLKALKASTTANPRAYVDIPGIDVPFHSSVLRPGVPAFAQKLDELLPERIDIDALRGRYIPNLVARPFELTQEFVDAILAVVPSERLKGVKVADLDDNSLARLLLIELLSWQFASPVRWIETQALIIENVDQIIEVGLAASPTLTNLALRTMDVIGISRPVFNVERDQDQVMLNDVRQAPVAEIEEETPTPGEPAPVVEAAPVAAPTAPVAAPVAVSDAPELKFNASNAIMTLFALQNKINIDQITGADTSETLTNGVSSRRNQMLMDMSTELGVPTIDGAADADVATLQGRVVTAAPGYKPFGSVLAEAVRARLRTLTGAAGLKNSYVAERVTGTWGLPESWVAHVEAELLLGTREGESVRGGTLGSLPAAASNKGEVDALIDAAVNNVGAANGTAVSMSSGGAASGGGVVDSAALDAYAATVTGEEGVLANVARGILAQLGLDTKEEFEAVEADTELYEAVEAELGTGWLKLVTPVFSADRAILFDDRWASAREDLARLANGTDVAIERFIGTGETVSKQAAWWSEHVADTNLAATLAQVSKLALEAADEPHSQDIALVTGAAPESIAGAVAGRLLSQGATVIMTASNVSQARKEYARKLYAQHASPNAKLWIVPANMSSYRDVDAVIDWIGAEQRVTVGGSVTITKPALIPTLAYPFAAPSVSGSLADAGPQAENQARLLLWSVERTIAGLANLSARGVDGRVHIVLPGSPNRGMFGGDGAYGEVKAAFDAILAKWGSESGWPENVTLAQARIGWVAGTGLMGRNDVLIPAAEKLGIHVYTPEEISTELLGLASVDSRKKALEAPIDYDLTGGLGGGVSIAELAASLEQDGAATEAKGAATSIKALPSPKQPVQAIGAPVGEVSTDLDDLVVVVGVGEISSWGSGRTRFEAEYGIQRDGSVELTAAGVLELAWMMGLISWSEDPRPGWYDADGTEIPEEDIFDRLRDEVVARCGVRALVDDAFLVDGGSLDAAEVFLDRDISFTVNSAAEAQAYIDADSSATITEADGEWTVTKKKGSTSFVPRKATLTRSVAAQLPTDFDPAKWGIPASMIDAMDNITAWNLVTAVDAFLSSGFSPAELLQSIHPADVSSTQGTGIGGMQSLHKLFVNRFLGQDRPSDILQETLPNVVAAHTMQSYVGGYGQMIHPVAACATAAVSVEEGVDKIQLGKADFVVAGGIDDIQVESLTGFGDMNATADTQAMLDKGIDSRFISRANDRRRGGFLEAAGGGTVLLARASVAADLALPVLAVVAHAQSYADGAHTSIPAPGLGALGAARGGVNSRLARELKSLGLTPDDVRVVSKHDTSTNANDPNESELHSLLWKTIGREADNPLFVISQKSLTGHSKGGAALFQIGGLVSVLESGKLPQNASLDCVDPEMQQKGENFVWLRQPLELGAGAIKAGVLTSLGFGHVAAVVVLATSGVFEQAMRNAGRNVQDWRERATQRLRAGANRLEAGMVGRAPLFEQIDGRRLPERGGHQAEINLLIDATARLGADGTYPLGK